MPWHSHVILQYKLKDLHFAADFIDKNYWIGMQKPVINDERFDDLGSIYFSFNSPPAHRWEKRTQ